MDGPQDQQDHLARSEGIRHAEIDIQLSNDESKIVFGALSPETVRKIPRTDTSVLLTDHGVKLVIDAQDTSSLRAAINSYLRWLRVATDVQNTIDVY